MFDFGSGELLVIGVVALVVIGPKELPGLLRTVGQTVTRLRRIAGDFQGQFQSALREADLHDAMKSVSDIQSTVSDGASYNDPLANLPMPSLPDPVTEPPAELKAPAPAPVMPSPPVAASAHAPATKSEPASSDQTESKASRKRAVKAKTKPDDPQAALFDTIDQTTDTTEAKPTSKKSGATKSNVPTKSAAKPKAKIVAKPAVKANRKTKTGEASS